jgi:hypothetical protein
LAILEIIGVLGPRRKEPDREPDRGAGPDTPVADLASYSPIPLRPGKFLFDPTAARFNLDFWPEPDMVS